MDEDARIRREIVEVGRRMYRKGLIAAADGNVTVRTDKDELYVTPSGACKGDLAPEDVVVTDLAGRKLRGERRPSSEIEMHVAVYQVRPDVKAVVHAHPPLATGFAAAGVPFSPALLSEIVLTLGCVPLAEYATPTTSELAETIKAYASRYDGLLLANHGAVTLGTGPFDAYFKMETVEHYAKINLVTKILGSERPLPGAAVEKLVELRRRAGLGGGDPFCAAVPAAPGAGAGAGASVTLSRDELVDLIVRALEAGA
jgi:L-fuculose-phosphate aldolase